MAVPVQRNVVPLDEIEETIAEKNASEFEEDDESDEDEEDTPATTVEEMDESAVTVRSKDAHKLRSGRVSKKKQNSTVTLGGVIYHPCDVCGKTFTTSSGRSRHKCSHSPNNTTIAIRCELCNKTFTTTAGKTKHMKIKDNSGTQLSSVSTQNISEDNSVHTSMVTIRCDLCQKTFTTAAGKTKHMK